MPKLIVVKGPLKGKIFDLGNNDTVFCGRNPQMNDISILDITVSRKHFKIFRIGKSLFVEDLKSKHGTIVNNKLIKPGEGFQIEDRDLITIGTTVMRLIEDSKRGSPARKEIKDRNEQKAFVSDELPKRERRSAKELELIYKISELFKKQLNIQDFFENVLELVLEALPRIDSARFFLFRNHKKEITEVVAKSQNKSIPKYSKKLLDRVIQERKTVRMSNTDFESPEHYVDSADTLEIKSLLCVPIISGNDILGAIYLDSLKPYGFRKEDQLVLNSLVGPMAVAIEKDRLISDSSLNPANHRTGKNKINNLVKNFFSHKKFF